MKLGFTGTQSGMTTKQRVTFIKALDKMLPKHFVHGDCIGADAEASELVATLLPDCKRIIYPQTDKSKRAFCTGDVIYKPMPPLTRNRSIVNLSQVMLAIPRLDHPELRSGTWATVRFAVKQGKKVIIIWPDGSIDDAATLPKLM